MAVYLDRIRVGTAIPQALLLVKALAEHLHDLTVAGGIVVVEHTGLQLFDDQTAVLLGLVVDLVGQLCGLRAFLRRILEHTDTLNADILQELTQLGKLVLGLTRQTDDQACTQYKPRNTLAHILDQPGKFRAVTRTVHGTQNTLRDMLQRNIQILYDFRLIRNHVDQLVRNLVGIEIVQTNPGKVHLAQLAQQLGQQALMLGQVHTVLGDVLRDDDQLLNACVRERTRFLEQRCHLTAAVTAAQLGDDTVRAGVRAALRNLKVCGVRGCQAVTAAVECSRGHIGHIRRLLPLERRIGRVHDVIIAARSAEYVDLGQLSAHLVSIALHQTAGHDQTLHISGLLVLGGLQNGFDSLGLSGFDEAAGVDNANVCFGHILGDLPACVPQPGQHMLAVHEVFRAAERNKS